MSFRKGQDRVISTTGNSKNEFPEGTGDAVLGTHITVKFLVKAPFPNIQLARPF